MAHRDVPYSSCPPTAGELAGLNVDFGDDGLARWTCPRCGAEFVEEIDTDQPVYAFELKSVGEDLDHGVMDLICECGHKHGDATDCGFAASQPVKRV